MPPDTEIVALPSHVPEHWEEVVVSKLITNVSGSVIVIVDDVVVQPFASVMVALYVPVHNPVAVESV